MKTSGSGMLIIPSKQVSKNRSSPFMNMLRPLVNSKEKTNLIPTATSRVSMKVIHQSQLMPSKRILCLIVRKKNVFDLKFQNLSTFLSSKLTAKIFVTYMLENTQILLRKRSNLSLRKQKNKITNFLLSSMRLMSV